jgi:hypothetical protein
MMNENAKAWVAALRSGEYLQIKNALTDDGGYCCLGIACVVADKAGVPAAWRNISYLSDSVRRWLGLEDEIASYGDGQSLANDNDFRNKTFAEIADIIESEPEGLFVEVQP